MEKNKFLQKAKTMAQQTNDGLQPLALKVTKSVNDFASTSGRIYDASGAKDKMDAITGTVSEGFDVVSGQAMYQAVQEHLAVQEQYNDVLANKLFEALERIKKLEEKLEGTK